MPPKSKFASSFAANFNLVSSTTDTTSSPADTDQVPAAAPVPTPDAPTTTTIPQPATPQTPPADPAPLQTEHEPLPTAPAPAPVLVPVPIPISSPVATREPDSIIEARLEHRRLVYHRDQAQWKREFEAWMEMKKEAQRARVRAQCNCIGCLDYMDMNEAGMRMLLKIYWNALHDMHHGT